MCTCERRLPFAASLARIPGADLSDHASGPGRCVARAVGDAEQLRGIKDSPPYLHDDRLLTLEDTVEFFNIVLELKLNEQEKKDLVAFMRVL
jgi:hypothetical protein